MDHETSDLRRQARLNEVDRQLASHRFRLAAAKWVGVPLMLLIGGYVAYVLHGRGMPSTENLMAGSGGVASVLLAGVGGYRAQRRRLDELEQERADLESPNGTRRIDGTDSNHGRLCAISWVTLLPGWPRERRGTPSGRLSDPSLPGDARLTQRLPARP